MQVQLVEIDRLKNENREALTALRKKARTTKTSVPSPFEPIMSEIDGANSRTLVKEVCRTCGDHDSMEHTWMMFPGSDVFARVPFHAAHAILEKDQESLDYESKKLQSYVKDKSLAISEKGMIGDKISPGLMRSLLTLTDKSNGSRETVQLISMLMLRLIAAHEAIRVARQSHLPSELIKLVTGCVGDEKTDKPSASIPQAFLKWLLKLEEQGLRVFVDGISKFHSKLVFDESSTDCGHTLLKPETTRRRGRQSYGRKSGHMQMMDASIDAAHTMKFTAKDGRRKRKEARTEEGKTQFKFLKYKLHESYLKENSSHSGPDSMNSGSEAENPMSDEDVEEMEQ
ncbi:hypothetical protein ACLOJK_036812 [Asimina triloba]